MSIRATMLAICGTIFVLMVVALNYTLLQLNKARTERDTATERSNSNGSQVRLCRAELKTATDQLSLVVVTNNARMSELASAAEQLAIANKTSAEFFYKQATKWDRSVVKALEPRGDCPTRLDNINSHIDGFYQENFRAK